MYYYALVCTVLCATPLWLSLPNNRRCSQLGSADRDNFSNYLSKRADSVKERVLVISILLYMCMTMNSKLLSRLGKYSGAGVVGYIVGSFVEKWKLHDVSQKDSLPHWPGLPVFGTVSAATPFAPDTQVAVPGGEVTYSKPTRIAQIMKYGFPSLDNLRSLDDYVLAYDQRNRVAYWVFEHLTAESIKRSDTVDRSKCEFTEDKSIHPYFRSTNADYKGSGFDRGHLAAAGNHRICQKHCEQTFLLSNMAPQVGVGFNRDSWNSLEKHIRKLTRTYPNVYVCTGPLYLPRKDNDGKTYVKYEVIGGSHVAVPTHFFKIVVMETADSKLHLESYVMPNQKIDNSTPLTVFMVPPESIERAAGLLFFDKMSRSNLIQINGRKTTYV